MSSLVVFRLVVDELGIVWVSSRQVSACYAGWTRCVSMSGVVCVWEVWEDAGTGVVVVETGVLQLGRLLWQCEE